VPIRPPVRPLTLLVPLFAALAAHASPEPLVLWSQPARADAVAFSSDGRYVASGTLENRSPFTLGHVDLWNAADGAALEYTESESADTLGDTRDVTFSRVDEAWSPDSTRVASIDEGGAVLLRNGRSGERVYTLAEGRDSTGGTFVSVAFSPEGDLVAAGTEGPNARVRVWRVNDGTLVHDLDAGVPPGAWGSAVVAFCPNGDFVTAALRERFPGEDWSGEIRFWDRMSGDVVAEYSDAGPAPGSGGITNLAFSPARDHEFAYAAGGAVKVATTPLSLATRTLGVGPGEDLDQLTLAAPGTEAAQVSFLFTPSASRHVSVEAFDAEGRRVASLFDGDVRAGVPALWTLDGNALPNGQYLVHVRGDGIEVVREVTLVR